MKNKTPDQWIKSIQDERFYTSKVIGNIQCWIDNEIMKNDQVSQSIFAFLQMLDECRYIMPVDSVKMELNYPSDLDSIRFHFVSRIMSQEVFYVSIFPLSAFEMQDSSVLRLLFSILIRKLSADLLKLHLDLKGLRY